MESNLHNLEGNHACALGAIAAGCRFYAGYPITPSSEIAERMALELPRVDGVFIQMEDEIASMGAIIGASYGGTKSMTATSGPGFSLKQENLGYAAAAEIPCVVVNVMRGGPSTGMPTRPSQGDVMQARWGTHGDHPVIVLTPASVQEIYQQTIRAFNLSEFLRIPVVVLYDETIGHLLETVELAKPGELKLHERKWSDKARDNYLPYAADENGIPVMARPGDGYRSHVTGLTHAENGFPTQEPAQVTQVMERLLGKVERHREIVESCEITSCEDAELVIVAFGIAARAASRAVKLAREEGIRAGLFRPITLWPFPADTFQKFSRGAKKVIVAEMNAGQLITEIQRFSIDNTRVCGVNRIDGEPIVPADILEEIRSLS